MYIKNIYDYVTITQAMLFIMLKYFRYSDTTEDVDGKIIIVIHHNSQHLSFIT